ncbi:hypothetical protein BJY01DRAFT_250391 [Aspergillus pseudoustus]|uniref:Uncharacterized protein n=1 Tax=Aspergillus pseudoustus TaxID=1810923 RepID=A0ABR4JHY4_9EURO
MYFTLPLLAGIIATASALDCLSPPAPSPLNLCKPWTVRWDYVDSDPTQFCIYLSNYELSGGALPHAIQVAGPVNRNDRQASIPGACRPELGISQHRVWLSACGAPLTIFDQCNPLSIQQPCCWLRRVDARAREAEVEVEQ